MSITKTELKTLETTFSQVFPEYHSQLKACKTQDQLEKAMGRIKQEVVQKAKPYLSDAEAVTGFPMVALTPEMYANLINATGNNVQMYATSLLNALKVIQPDFSVGQTVATLIGSGFTAIGDIAGAAFGEGIVAGSIEAVASAAGVAAVTVAGLVMIIAVAVIAVILPILYFMLKPASCFAFVLNETSQTLSWVDDFNVHGKPIGYTASINPAINIPSGIDGSGKYVYAGLVQTDKNDDALVGTQYGFTYSNGTAKINFGMECPLTSIYVDNNCFCTINGTSEDVANQTDSANVLSSSTSIQNPYLGASIVCNSPSGYTAYYIARVMDGSLA